MLIKKKYASYRHQDLWPICSNQLTLFYLFFSDIIRIIVGCIAFIILYIRLVKYVGHRFFVVYRGGGSILLICKILNIEFYIA